MKKKTFRCAWCFNLNEILVDISVGRDQEYVEDCQICCRPNTIHVHFDDETLNVTVASEAEG